MQSMPLLRYVVVLVLAVASAFASAPWSDGPVAGPISLRIAGGRDADARVVKSVAYVFVYLRRRGKAQTRERACSGSVLSLGHVVTAAHCVQPADPHDVLVAARVWVNRRVLTRTEAFNQSATDVTHFHIHRRFDGATFKNDIAILTLAAPIGERARPVVLPQPGLALRHRAKVFVAGYGRLSRHGRMSNTLQMVALRFRNYSFCVRRAWIAPNRGGYILCATSPDFRQGGRGPCLGDSGGPLFTRDASQRIRLLGISSHVNGDCGAPFSTTYYTRVSSYVHAIRRFLNGKVTTDWKRLKV